LSVLLVETYDTGLELIRESKELPANCLGVLKGVCADYKDPTRNGRFYSEKLWRKVFDDERIKEGLTTKTLFGELDHPADRLESLAKEAAIVMTNYEFDESDKKVLGEFHILDTPNGRILKSLVDYGSKLGISSRGRGEINEKDNTVEEDSFIFGGFDAVTLPSIKSARPEYKLTNESLEVKSFKSSLEKEIDEAVNLEELEKIKKVIGYTELPETTSNLLIESIEQRQENFKKECKKSCNSTTVDKKDNKLQEDLEEAYKKINELEKELKLKDRDSTSSKDGCCKNKVEESEDNDDELDEVVFTDTISTEELYLQLADMRSSLEERRDFQAEIESINGILNEKRRRIEVLENEKKSLIEKTGNLYETCSSYEKDMAFLRERLNILETDYSNLQEDLKDKYQDKGEVKSLEKERDELSEAIDKLKSEKKLLNEKLKSYGNYHVSLEEELSELRSKLEESNANMEEIKSNLEEISEAYISTRSNQSGISVKDLKNSLDENYSVKDIEDSISNLYEEKSRMSNLPFGDSELFSLKEHSYSGRQDYKNAKAMLNTMKTKKEGGNK